MKNLSYNWFSEGLIDFEYKKYVLLAYLQEIEKYFNDNKLYPQLSELVLHYNNLLHYKSNKEMLAHRFPERLDRINFEQHKLEHERLIKDDVLMEEIESIVDYSIPEIKNYLSEGKNIYDFVEKQLFIYPVGLVPLYSNEGYLFLMDGEHSNTRVYEYSISIFENKQEKYRGINTNFISEYNTSVGHTIEDIKIDLIKKINKLPNPAVYVAETEMAFPEQETLLPVAKRSLVKHLFANA